MALIANNDVKRPEMTIWAGFATYSKICIGWLQCLSMCELCIAV